MYCEKCGKNHAGYRCPYCGDFVLKDVDLHDKRAKSKYAKKRRRDEAAYNLSSFIIIFVVLLLIVGIGVFCFFAP